MAIVLMNIIYGIVGLGGGWLLYYFNIRRTPAMAKVIGAIGRKNKLVFLETHNGTYFREVIKQYGTLGVTAEKELLIIPPDSTKPCLNLGGLQIGHGDFSRSILVPLDLMKFKDEMKSYDLRDDDVAQFFKDVQELPKDKLKAKLEGEKITLTDKLTCAIINGGKSAKEKPADFNKYKLYMMMPSLVSTFIYTGLNRVSIHEMLRNLVAQRELEKLGQRNWIGIGILILLVLVGLALASKWILPALAGYKAATATSAAAAASRIGG